MREAELGMNLDSSMETCITICKIDSQWKFAVKFRGLKLGLGNNLEGAMGRQVEGMLKLEGT